MSNQVADCCASIGGQAIELGQAADLARMFKALGDPVRLRMLSLIAAHEGGESCVCDISPAFDLSQPTISHHLKVLREAGLLGSERRGTWVYYIARPDAMAALGSLFTAGSKTLEGAGA